MEIFEIVAESAEETKKIAANLAEKIKKRPLSKYAFIIALEGNLGSGKTTFIQGLAKDLKIKESVLSPTFLILKQFPIALKNHRNFYHIDAYRLKNSKELLELGFKDLMNNPENIIVIEWAGKVRRLIPRGVVWIKFINQGENRRKITFKSQISNLNAK